MRQSIRWYCALFMIATVVATTHAQSSDSSGLGGKVFTEGTLKPIVGAQIFLPEISKSAVTDDKGAFRIIGIPPGVYLVRARRVGFLAFETRIEFRSGMAQQLPIVLPQITALDSLRVVGEIYTPLSLLENRAHGLGHFITREDLEKQEGQRLPNILAQISGLGMAYGKSAQGWVLSKRVVPRLPAMGRAAPAAENTPGTDIYAPDVFDKRNGMVAGCHARVYLDGTLLNAGTPAEPVDVNQFTTKSIEAIEYYAGPSQTPGRYNSLNSACGVLVIHSRRSP